jgi:hypothetical protein
VHWLAAAIVVVLGCSETRPPALIPAATAERSPPIELALLSGQPWSSRSAVGRMRDPTESLTSPPLSITKLPTVIVLDRLGRTRFRADELAEAGYDALPSVVDALAAE